MLMSGPPEFPEEIGVSVWMSALSAPVSVIIVRFNAEITPDVTLGAPSRSSA